MLKKASSRRMVNSKKKTRAQPRQRQSQERRSAQSFARSDPMRNCCRPWRNVDCRRRTARHQHQVIDTFIGSFRQSVWPKPCPLADVNEIRRFKSITWHHQFHFTDSSSVLSFRLSWTERRRAAAVKFGSETGFSCDVTWHYASPNVVHEFGNSRHELPKYRDTFLWGADKIEQSLCGAHCFTELSISLHG